MKQVPVAASATPLKSWFLSS